MQFDNDFPSQPVPPTAVGRLTPRPTRRAAFTLKELLIVIGIIGLLVSILLPTMGRARKQAKIVQCTNNLKSLQTALISYINANRHSVDYAPMDPSNASNVNQNLRSMNWEGALKSQLSNDAVLYCPEAAEPTDAFYGSATQAHGTKQVPPSPPAIPGDAFSSGSYGINGFLYYQDPAQMKVAPAGGPIVAGLPLVPSAKFVTMKDFWFDDLTTLDGGVVPTFVRTKNPNLPTTFGGASSVPAFGDCNAPDSWPDSDGTTFDPTPSSGNYSMNVGDQGGPGHMLGRFCLDRHPGGVNIVFLDGHVSAVALRDLWQLRWNKKFVPVALGTFP